MQSELDLTQEALFQEHIAEFCRRWRVEELSLDPGCSGGASIANEQLRIRFEPQAEWSFTERLRMQREFRVLSGKEIRFKRYPLRQRNQFSRVLFNA